MRFFAAIGAAAALAVLATPGASASLTTVKCRNYTYRGYGFTDKYSRIRATGVKCGRADEVLGTFSNSAPGGTDLGFTCRRRKTKTRHVYDLKCTDGAKRITATAKFSP